MPDIALRFHKDMLVFSAPLEFALAHQGIDAERDRGYLTLMEPEALRDALRMEQLAGAQCLVTATSAITPARLAARRLERDAARLAKASCALVRELAPQHLIVEIGPCGLPLDPSSKASLNEHRDQYVRAARLFADEQVDALFLNGFSNTTDLKCALMGAFQVCEVPLFASIDVDAEGALDGGRETLEEACAVMAGLDAAVMGFACACGPEQAASLARRARAAADLPLLVQLQVTRNAPKQGIPTEANPYGRPDSLISAAAHLHAAGAQFLRATGEATSAFTGALAATVLGLGVAGR